MEHAFPLSFVYGVGLVIHSKKEIEIQRSSGFKNGLILCLMSIDVIRIQIKSRYSVTNWTWDTLRYIYEHGSMGARLG
jgi:hypothetical protein